MHPRFFCLCVRFVSGSRITSSPNGCILSHTLAFRMTWLGGTLPYLILYGSQNDVKIKAQASPTLNLHSCYLISPGFPSGVPVPIINLELRMFEVSVSIRTINWMYQRIWSKEREDDMRSNPQRYNLSVLSCRSLPPCATVICDTHCWWWLISSWRWVVFQGLWRWRMWR